MSSSLHPKPTPKQLSTRTVRLHQLTVYPITRVKHLILLPGQSPPCPNLLVQRGRGRPRKSQLAAHDSTTRKRPTRSWQRERHNGSATRSRAKFNDALDTLWKSVPKEQQLQGLGPDISRQISRAEKIEIVISYVRVLHATLRGEL